MWGFDLSKCRRELACPEPTEGSLSKGAVRRIIAKKGEKMISPLSSNGRTESFEKTLFKVADRKY